MAMSGPHPTLLLEHVGPLWADEGRVWPPVRHNGCCERLGLSHVTTAFLLDCQPQRVVGPRARHEKSSGGRESVIA